MITRLALHMQKIGLSQSNLARKAGIDPATVYNLCKGSLGTKITREKVSKALGVPINKLFPEAERK